MNSTMTLAAASLCVLVATFAVVRWLISGFGGYHRSFTARSDATLREAFVFVDSSRWFFYTVGAAILLAALLGVLTRSVVAVVVVPVFVFAVPNLVYRVIRNRRRAKLVLQLPDALTMLSSSMRAGTSLQTALDIVIKETPAPLAQELGVVAREQRLGVALEDALESMARRLKMEDVDLVVAAMTIAKQVGGNLAEILERLSGTLRAKLVMEGKIRALTSQGKLQGWIVGALPIFLGLMLWAIEPASMALLVTSGLGWTVVGVIAIMEGFGAFLIKKIVTIDI